MHFSFRARLIVFIRCVIGNKWKYGLISLLCFAVKSKLVSILFQCATRILANNGSKTGVTINILCRKWFRRPCLVNDAEDMNRLYVIYLNTPSFTLYTFRSEDKFELRHGKFPYTPGGVKFGFSLTLQRSQQRWGKTWFSWILQGVQRRK